MPGRSGACAACKYQRRKCSTDCPLAPYFPADNPRQFQNAHRLYGVTNILKILAKLDGPHRAEAMRSIIYESNIRDRFPVHGCLGIISDLCLQLHHVHLQLLAIHSQLAILRSAAAAAYPYEADNSYNNDEYVDVNSVHPSLWAQSYSTEVGVQGEQSHGLLGMPSNNYYCNETPPCFDADEDRQSYIGFKGALYVEAQSIDVQTKS